MRNAKAYAALAIGILCIVLTQYGLIVWFSSMPNMVQWRMDIPRVGNATLVKYNTGGFFELDSPPGIGKYYSLPCIANGTARVWDKVTVSVKYYFEDAAQNVSGVNIENTVGDAHYFYFKEYTFKVVENGDMVVSTFDTGYWMCAIALFVFEGIFTALYAISCLGIEHCEDD